MVIANVTMSLVKKTILNLSKYPVLACTAQLSLEYATGRYTMVVGNYSLKSSASSIQGVNRCKIARTEAV